MSHINVTLSHPPFFLFNDSTTTITPPLSAQMSTSMASTCPTTTYDRLSTTRVSAEGREKLMQGLVMTSPL